MRTSLRGIANRAKKDGKARFGNLYGLLNEANLRECFYRLKRGAAPGVDGVSFHEYEKELPANIRDLVERLKGKRYKAKLVRRKHIPKAGGKTRPLGIPALEDKLLQMGVASVLSAIYEEEQGGIISPVLANIYLHYALDLWFERKVRPHCRGQAMLMRFADDFVCAFENRDEAEGFMGWMTERLGKFGLELAGEKTGICRFSRERMKENGGFRFLGFLYHWTLSRNGRPKVQRMTDPEKLRKSVAAFKEWIKKARHQRADALMRQLKRKLSGYWNYYGVTGNGGCRTKKSKRLAAFDFFWP